MRYFLTTTNAYCINSGGKMNVIERMIDTIDCLIAHPYQQWYHSKKLVQTCLMSTAPLLNVVYKRSFTLCYIFGLSWSNLATLPSFLSIDYFGELAK